MNSHSFSIRLPWRRILFWTFYLGLQHWSGWWILALFPILGYPGKQFYLNVLFRPTTLFWMMNSHSFSIRLPWRRILFWTFYLGLQHWPGWWILTLFPIWGYPGGVFYLKVLFRPTTLGWMMNSHSPTFCRWSKRPWIKRMSQASLQVIIVHCSKSLRMVCLHLPIFWYSVCMCVEQHWSELCIF
jgi:hypothetical protein